MNSTNALIAIDIQNDFCPGGALAVSDGDAVVAPTNRLLSQFSTRILTQDWHPAGHSSFASSHSDKDPFSLIDMPYGPQVLWPDHCVQGSAGADFHPDLETDRAQIIIRKGYNPQIDSYSAFFENDRTTPTGLDGALRTLGVETVYLTGLATDFCVNYSALDARRLGYRVVLVDDAMRAIDLDGSLEAARAELSNAGVDTALTESLI